MKKILYLLMACILLVGVSACTDDTLSFEYSFNIDGHATGDVDVTFPGGDLTLKGNAELGFRVDSPSYFVSATKASPDQLHSATLNELQSSNKKNYRHVADAFLADYDAAFSATAAEGTYYLHITGSVKEKSTGIEIKIDKVLTNEEILDEGTLDEEPDYKSE